ncbi:MAG TPA: DUF3710 domain-containing protein [Pseudonocardia sp.]
MARTRGGALATSTSTGAQNATQRMRATTNGPHDSEALDAKFIPSPGTVDFGAVRVPIPADGSVVVEPSAAGRMQAVHVSVPEGRLSVSALASPRNEGLWPDLATEIDGSLREGGARVRSFTGEWGRELHATTNGATSVFVGVDGPRWMLYGVATGPTRDAVALDARLRRMLRGTVVVRGKAPYPVRTVLPLTATPQPDGEGQGVALATPTMTMRAPTSDGAADSTALSGAAAHGAGSNGAAVNGAAPNGAAASGLAGISAGSNGAAVNGAARNGAAVNGAATNGAAVNGAAVNGTAVNGTAANGTATSAAGPRGATTHSAASNGYAPEAGFPPGPPAMGAGEYGRPYPAPPPSGAWPRGGVPHTGPNGAGPNATTPTGNPALGTGFYNAANYNGANYDALNYNAANYNAANPGVGNGANGYRPPTNGAAFDNGATPGNGAGPDSAAGSGSYPGGYPTGTTAAYPTGAAASGPPSNGAPLNGWNPAGAPPSGPHAVGESTPSWGGPNGVSAYGAPPPAGATNGLSGYGAPQQGASYDRPSLGGVPAPYGTAFDQTPSGGAPRNGQGLAPSHTADPASTGGPPRRGVPTGWAHETGSHRRGQAAPGPSSPPPPSSTSAFPSAVTPARQEPQDSLSTPLSASLSELPWEPLAAAAPLPDWSAAELMTPPPPPAPSYYASPSVEPTRERRSSWDDSHDARAEPAPASSPTHWDPLADPLPAGLDPLPEPVPTWSAAVAEPSAHWRTEAGYGDPPPDAGAPLYDAVSAFSSRAAEQSDIGTPLYDVASSSGRRRSTAPDVPADHYGAADVGTPLFDAASTGARRTTDRNGYAAGASGLGDEAGEPGGRSRRDSSAPYGTARPDLPRRTRRHGEPGDEPPRAAPPSAGLPGQETADEARSGRRRARETQAATGRHDAGATFSRYRDDTPARHADPENRHAAPSGSAPRMPPTQWAWPKAEPPSFDNPYETPSGRRAADTGSTSWSAAELLDTRHEGGRRRRGDAGRHGRPADPESGRHQR